MGNHHKQDVTGSQWVLPFWLNVFDFCHHGKLLQVGGGGGSWSLTGFVQEAGLGEQRLDFSNILLRKNSPETDTSTAVSPSINGKLQTLHIP